MVDEHLRHLKSVLERDGRHFIDEIDGTGYRFEACPHTKLGAGSDAE